MKTEQEIKNKIKRLNILIESARNGITKEDDIAEMEMLSQIEILTWVLKNDNNNTINE